MKLGRLFGIDIRIDLSWLFVFALAAWSLSSNVGPFHAVTSNAGTRILLGVCTAALFFASILLHELAHSLTARARGMRIQGITLFIFGGVSHFEGEPSAPPSAAWISLIGPLTSLALGALFSYAAAVIGTSNAYGAAAGYLAFANIAIGVFNLLPAFPLDGGRVLHAVLWSVLKDRARATRAAVVVGKISAWLLITFGAYETLLFGFGGGLWITFMGWFLLQAGEAEAMQTDIAAALKGHSVREVAEPLGQTLAPNLAASAAFDMMRAQRVRALPVMLGEQFLGLVSLSDFAKASSDALDTTFVTALMTRKEALASIEPDAGASEALKRLAECGRQQLPIIDAEGGFHGFITAQGLLRWAALDREKLMKIAVKR